MTGIRKTALDYRTIDGYGISPNEALTRMSVNRALEHLLHNDELLKKSFDRLGFFPVVQTWRSGANYFAGDVVTFVDRTTSVRGTAYILLCMKDGADRPVNRPVSGRPNFDDSGWKLVHESTFYLDDQEALTENIIRPVVEESILEHELGTHHHGAVIKSESDFSKTFLKSDLSNFVSSTEESAYSSAKYGNGAYLAKSSSGIAEFDVEFSFDETANQEIQIENSRYYLGRSPIRDDSDDFVFCLDYGEKTASASVNGLHYQNLRIPGTNIFTALVKFPAEFANTDYCIFQSSYEPGQFVYASSLSDLESRTEPDESAFTSKIMFMDKTTASVRAILPIHPYFGGPETAVGVPWKNKFRLHAVGKAAE